MSTINRVRKSIAAFIFLFLLLFLASPIKAIVTKWIDVGKIRARVFDSGIQNEVRSPYFYYDFDYFGKENINSIAFNFAAGPWTDAQGNEHPAKIAGTGHVFSNEEKLTIPVPDENEVYIKRYMRYEPPTVVVDGVELSDPWPMEGDEVAPNKIKGTADVMVGSWFRTALGLTVHQRVYGWSQRNHDDYILYDWTVINTGNIDLDQEIELEENPINDLYFFRVLREFWWQRTWYSADGQYQGDSLRIQWMYPSRSPDADFDDLGDPNITHGFLERPGFVGEVMLYFPETVDYDAPDDVTQPRMTAWGNSESSWNKVPPTMQSQGDQLYLYDVEKNGFGPQLSDPNLHPNTHHAVPYDERDIRHETDVPWWNYQAIDMKSSGPLNNFEKGDSIRIAWATVRQGFSTEKAWEVGQDWVNGNAKWVNAQGDSVDVTAAELAEYYPAFERYPDLAPTVNDMNKDRWVLSGRDSLMASASAAQWNFEHGYNVPVPPVPPDVTVSSEADKIQVNWEDNNRHSDDTVSPEAEGYRVYRAKGNPNPQVIEGKLRGQWEMVFETTDPSVTSFADTTAQRGEDYYYYVTAFADAQDPGVYGHALGELESGKYLTRTTQPASLLKAASSSLDNVAVVPNPYNVSAREVQFSGAPNKIVFMELPPQCTVEIYSESGDLVETLEHTDGSGDEPWGHNFETYQTTDTGQVVVSGVYIAHITTPGGESRNVKFVIIR